MFTIIVRQRAFDWIAYIEGYKGIETWESGKTEEEAIGKLMITLSLLHKHIAIKHE